MNDHHAHTILNWIKESPTGRSIDAIVNWSKTSHGQLATYHTCCKSRLTIQQLLSFLIQAKKVDIIAGKLVLQPEKMCSH